MRRPFRLVFRSQKSSKPADAPQYTALNPCVGLWAFDVLVIGALMYLRKQASEGRQACVPSTLEIGILVLTLYNVAGYLADCWRCRTKRSRWT